MKGSASRRKKVQRLANAHRKERVSNHHAVHRFTSHIARQYDFIAVEDLDIGSMTASGRGTASEPGTLVQVKADRNRMALQQTWGKIRQQLAYKAEWAGRQFVEVDPAFTSRTCSRCGTVATAPQLSPVFRCGSCGLQGVTAHNAAVNILRRGLGSGESGTTGPGPLPRHAVGCGINPGVGPDACRNTQRRHQLIVSIDLTRMALGAPGTFPGNHESAAQFWALHEVSPYK